MVLEPGDTEHAIAFVNFHEFRRMVALVTTNPVPAGFRRSLFRPLHGLPIAACQYSSFSNSRSHDPTPGCARSRDIKLVQSAQTTPLAQSTRTENVRPVAMLWTTCAHKSPHSDGTSRRTPSRSDPLRLFGRSSPRILGKRQRRHHISVREAMTPEVGSGQWFHKCPRSPAISGCGQVRHEAHRASNNAPPFGCTEHGSLGTAECIFSFRRPCDAHLGLAKVALLSGALAQGHQPRRESLHTPLARL
jgi:hypothetical protein